MPASIRISSGYFKRETFEVWDAASDTFGPDVITGRKRRIGSGTTPSRREQLFVAPGTSTTAVSALRSTTTGIPYLVSQALEEDSWQKDGNIYEVLLHCQQANAPSGGAALHYPVTTLGSGDDLGAVQVGPPVLGWADAEFRTVTVVGGTAFVPESKYAVAYSRNLEVQEGDYLEVAGHTYLLLETHFEDGFSYAAARKEAPAFETFEFKLPSSTPSVFDPHTGRMTTVSEVSRLVSGYISDHVRDGNLPAHTISERLSIHIYARHIGFTPLLGHGVVYGQVRYTVDSVKRDLEAKQWHVEVSR